MLSRQTVFAPWPTRPFFLALIFVLGFALAVPAAQGWPLEPAPGTTDLGAAPTEAGWLHLPPLAVRVVPSSGMPVRVWASAETGDAWVPVALTGGRGLLPFPVATVAALWDVRFRVEPSDARVILEPQQALVLAPAEGEPADQATRFDLVNWGREGYVRARCLDAKSGHRTGRPFH
jgi:hypothetical protein